MIFEGVNIALHKHFSQYTAEEIKNIKDKVCVKHKCPYLTSFTTCNDRNGKQSSVYKACNYILFTGMQRDCMPDECRHYLDKNVPKKPKFSLN